MCERDTTKQRILAVADEWIGLCNDDICYNLDRLLEPQAERNLRELYDRKIELTKFRLAFGQNIQVGPTGYDRGILVEIINHLMEVEDPE